MATPGAVLGCRGDDGPAEAYSGIADAMLPQESERGSEDGVAMLRADGPLQHRCYAAAARDAERLCLQWSWTRVSYLATRAEVRLLAGKRYAAAAFAAAEREVVETPYAIATLQRMRALAEDDHEALARALAAFEELACAFQAALTGWM